MSGVPGLVRLPKGPERQFGKFALVVKLGWGGMADVYLAVPQGQEPTFADALVVKRLKPDLVFDSEYRAMFKDEAKLALKLDHPNIVSAKETGDIDGQPYLSMEYLDGLPLDKILEESERGRLTRGEILRVMSELLAGMHHAHELKDEAGEPLDIVHRDVSPHNVFITYDGRVKLVDFGIAKSRDKAQHTSTGVVKGKIAYMAPEQALCSAVDKRADVFAAGVILWELITGKRYWGELSDLQILKTMTFGELPQLADHLPNASPELSSICKKALAITPDERYASAAEFREDIDRFIKKIGERVTGADLGESVARIAGDNRRALDHVIEQQFGRRSLIIRDDTPLNVEVPNSMRGTDGGSPPSRATLPEGGATVAPASGSSVSASVTSGEGPASARRPSGLPAEVMAASTLDPVSAPDLAGLPASEEASRAPAPTWQAPTKKARVWPWIALGAAVIGVGLVGARGLSTAGTKAGNDTPPAASSSNDASRRADVESAAPQAASTAPLPVASAASSTDAASGLVNVRIAVTPTDAKVRLDGTLLADDPFVAKFKKDGVAHRLSIEAPGYRAHSEMLVFDRDIDIKPTLDPIAGGAVRHPPPQTPSTATPGANGVVWDRDPWATKPKKK